MQIVVMQGSVMENEISREEFRELAGKMRRQLRIPQAKLARQIGVSMSALSRWESGYLDLPREAVKGIADAIDQQMSALAERGKLETERPADAIARGKETARRRRLVGASQSALAQKIAISRSKLSLHESGYVDLTQAESVRLGEALEVLEAEHPPITMTLAALLRTPEITEITDAELNADRLYSGLKLVRSGFAFLNASKEVELADDLQSLRKAELEERRRRFPWKAR